MTITTEKQQSGTLRDLVHDPGDAADQAIPAIPAISEPPVSPAPGRIESDRNNANNTEVPCTDNEKTIEKKTNRGPSPRAGKRFGWRSRKEDASKSGPNQKNPLPRDGVSIYISSQKRLPSGFGSVRYLGKGRKNAYAVHPPVKMNPGEKAIRPPALCYVPDRTSGFKVLSLYHAGLFEGGLERNPASLQARFSGMLSAIGMTAEEYPTGDLLLKARGTLTGAGGTSKETGHLLPKAGGSSTESGQSLQKTGGSSPETRQLLPKTGGSSPETGQPLPKTANSLPKTYGSVLTFLEIILQARRAANNTLVLPHEPPATDSAIAVAGDMITDSATDPARDSTMGSSIAPAASPAMVPTMNLSTDPSMDFSFLEQYSAEYLKADQKKDKTYVDLLLNMSLCFGQILKKMKQDESYNDPAKENAAHDILQRQMLKGIELLKTVSPEGSSAESPGEDYFEMTDSQDIMPDEGTILKKQIYENLLGNGPSGTEPLKGNGLPTVRDFESPQEKGLPTTRDIESSPGNGLPAIRYFESPQEKGLPTIREVYRDFYDFKYGPNAARRLSHSSRCATAAACRKLAPLFDRTLDEVSVIELQNLVNRTAVGGYSRSSVTDLVTLIRQLYRFAYPRELCTKEYGKYVVMPFTAEEIHHQDFTDDELQILWKHQNYPVVNMVLIMCYSGFRISEFTRENDMKTVFSKDGTTGYFMGGMKTKAGKNRIVPIHSAILPLVKKTLNSHGQPVYLCGKSRNRFRDDMKAMLEEIGIDTVPGSDLLEGTQTDALSNFRYHTPHSCRHTFSRLCESYGVNEADRRRMMGHSFGNDVTNGVYGHRSVKELSLEIEKIQIPIF